MDPNVETRLVEMWQNRRKSGQELRSHYEDRWIRNWQMYRNKKSTVKLRGQDLFGNRQLPDPYRVIETSLPQHVLNTFRNPQWFGLHVPSRAGEYYQWVVRSLLLQSWRRADGYRKTILGLKMCGVLGHITPKTTWRTEIGEREILDLEPHITSEGEEVEGGLARRTVKEVVYNGCDIEFPSNFDIWQDPSGNMLWVIQRLRQQSLSDLRRTNKDYSDALYKNLDKVEHSREIADATQDGAYTQYGGRDGDQDLHALVEGVPNLEPDDALRVEQCWGFVPPEIYEYDDTQWRLQLVANDSYIIRDVRAPVYDHKPPFDNVQSIPIPGQLYGDSVLTYLEDLFHQRSTIENLRIKDIAFNIFGTYAINGLADIQGQDMFKKAGGAVRITPEAGGSIRDAIIPIPRHPAAPDAYSESAIKERQILDVSGATEPFQGTAFGGRTTATEVELITQLGTSRFALATMWMDETFKKPILTRMFKYMQSRLTTPEAIRLSGRVQDQGEIDLSDLQYGVDIVVDSGLFGSLDRSRINNIMEIYNVLLADPESRDYVDIGKFASRISFRAGLDGADDFIRTEEQVQEIRERRRQEAIEAAAVQQGIAQGLGSAGPNPIQE